MTVSRVSHRKQVTTSFFSSTLWVLTCILLLERTSAFLIPEYSIPNIGGRLLQEQQQQQEESYFTDAPSLRSRISQMRRENFITSGTLLHAWGRNQGDGFSSSSLFWSTNQLDLTHNLRSHLKSRQRAWSPVILFMGKGDGKKKRKKKTSTSSSSTVSPASSSAAAASAAPRVSNNINVPVRHQIRWAQMNKEYQKKLSTPGFRQKKVVRTKYRRTWDEEEWEEKAEQRKRKGQDPDWDVILNRTAVQPLVIVDGYNVIHKWPRLKKHMSKGDPQRARQLLIDDLENLGSLKGWRIEVVFDGTRRSITGPLGQGPGRIERASASDKSHKKDVSKYGVRVVYTGVGIEADSYIESRCASAKNVTGGDFTGSFIVATDDSMIRLAGQSAGALCMGSDRFVQELKAVKGSVKHRVEAAMARANGYSIRPEKLQGTTMGVRFGRRSVVIEDKRKKKAESAKQELDEKEVERIIGEIKVEEDENGIPWWAQVPNQTVTNRRR